MIPIGRNVVRLFMQRKHYPRKGRFYPALFFMTYHLRSLQMKRSRILGKKWVLWRPLTPRFTMEFEGRS